MYEIYIYVIVKENFTLLTLLVSTLSPGGLCTFVIHISDRSKDQKESPQQLWFKMSSGEMNTNEANMLGQVLCECFLNGRGLSVHCCGGSAFKMYWIHSKP